MATADESEINYELKIFILTISSGILCILSLPQLIIGTMKICKMRKLQLPNSIFWTCLLSLFSTYLVMLTIFSLSTLVNYINDYETNNELSSSSSSSHNSSNPTQSNNGYLSRDDGLKHNDLMNNGKNKEIAIMISIGISMIELLFIISKASINLLFLCRLFYSFKDTLFHYSMKKLLPIFIFVIIESIIYISFSEIIVVHFYNKNYQFTKINKTFLTSYFCIDMIIRIVFISLFERGLYRLATSRSFKSNLKLFGFGGASIDQIELSCQPQTNHDEIVSFKSPLKDQINTNKNNDNNNDDINTKKRKSQSMINTATPCSNYLHPLSYQKTDRDDVNKFTLSSPTIPEGQEEESGSDNNHEIDINDTNFHYLDEEYQKEENENMINNEDETGTRTPSPPLNTSTASLQSISPQQTDSTDIADNDNNNNNHNNMNRIELPPSIDEGDELNFSEQELDNAINEGLNIKIANFPSNNDEKKSRQQLPPITDTASDNLPATTPSGASYESYLVQQEERTNTNIHNNKDHGRTSSQINDLLSMSAMCQDKRPSFALKYLNSSSFDTHTKDLVNLVTKFSVLVVWSTVSSIFAAIFFISFVIGFNDNKILQNIGSSYIALIVCFVEMHVVYLQLNGTEKWYKCLCGCCHNAWGKCCVCKLRRRLVKKIGKQHKAMTLKAAQNSNDTATATTTTVKLTNGNH